MKTIVTILFVSLCTFSVMAQTPTTLKLNLEKGKVYSMKTTSKQAIKQSANGQEFAIDLLSNNVTTWKVLQQEKDVMDIEFKFDSVSAKISSPMFNKETNSAKVNSDDPIELIMNRMSTYKLIAKISTSGKFLSFVNYGKYRDAIMMFMDSIPASKRDDAKKQAEMLLKESALQSKVEPLFAYLPDKAVNPNDSWETSFFNSANNMSMISMNTYTLLRLENKQAVITGNSEIETMPNSDPNAQMTQDLKGNSTFEGNIDLKTGLALKSTSVNHFEGATTVKNNGNELKMPIKMDGQSETTITF